MSRLHDHTQTHHTRQDASGRVISPLQRLCDNTQDRHPTIPPVDSNPQSQLAREATHPRVRPHGHWDRRLTTLDWREGKIDHGYQDASILRVVKRRFSVSFLSVHRPNNRSENSQIKLLLGRKDCRGISAPLASSKLSLCVQLNTRTA